MAVYVYDGDWEGLMTALFRALAGQELPTDIQPAAAVQPTFFDTVIRVQSDPATATRLAAGIRRRISDKAFHNVLYAYLSEAEGSPMSIYRYLKWGFEIGPTVDRYMADDRVLPVLRLVDRVSFERHRLLGLVRFRQTTDGIYYSSISPDGQVIGLMAPHFAERMANMDWIIHDVKRGLAALGHNGEWQLVNLPYVEAEFDETELAYQEMWKTYYKQMAIATRKNPKLRRGYMPVRYWKHLIEDPYRT
jgi:probable DNA metabolism protein